MNHNNLLDPIDGAPSRSNPFPTGNTVRSTLKQVPAPDWDKNETPTFTRMVGVSKAHENIVKMIEKYKDLNASVLITGETGTGKELVARSLHEASRRALHPFETVNCGATSEALLESELFGHVQGTFTDAKNDREGLFVKCSNGTLLLDELGEMPLSLQAKLLQVLQEGEIRPVGSTRTTKIGTRVIAATSKDLKQDAEAGSFRSDLYYRLSVLAIHVPPLRERPEDIPALVGDILAKLSAKYKKDRLHIANSEMTRLKEYPWPGNVRELNNALERAFILSKDGRLDLDHLFSPEANQTRPLVSIEGWPSPIPMNYHRAKTSFEKQYLSNLLVSTQGNVSEAARLAGKTRVEIYRFLSRNQIRPADFRIRKGRRQN